MTDTGLVELTDDELWDEFDKAASEASAESRRLPWRSLEGKLDRTILLLEQIVALGELL